MVVYNIKKESILSTPASREARKEMLTRKTQLFI